MLRSLACAVVAIVAGCGGSITTSPDVNRVRRVQLWFVDGGKSQGFALGDSTHLTFQAFDSTGALVPGIRPIYRSTDSSVLTVRQDGVILVRGYTASSYAVASVTVGGMVLTDSVLVITAVVR